MAGPAVESHHPSVVLRPIRDTVLSYPRKRCCQEDLGDNPVVGHELRGEIVRNSIIRVVECATAPTVPGPRMIVRPHSRPGSVILRGPAPVPHPSEPATKGSASAAAVCKRLPVTVMKADAPHLATKLRAARWGQLPNQDRSKCRTIKGSRPKPGLGAPFASMAAGSLAIVQSRPRRARKRP